MNNRVYAALFGGILFSAVAVADYGFEGNWGNNADENPQELCQMFGPFVEITAKGKKPHEGDECTFTKITETAANNWHIEASCYYNLRDNKDVIEYKLAGNLLTEITKPDASFGDASKPITATYVKCENPAKN